jgi:carbamoyltransferase
MSELNILGINVSPHDSSACLVVDGELVSFAMEERYSRIKHDSSFPLNSINHCLTSKGLGYEDIHYVANSWNYFGYEYEKLNWHIEHCLGLAEESSADEAVLYLQELMKRKRRYYKKFGEAELESKKILNCEYVNIDHHISHAYSAFPLSGFQSAAVLIVDGSGEKMAISMWHLKDRSLKFLKAFNLPHSLGFFYGAATQYLGFEQHDEEWKVMGWAPYGKAKYYEQFKNILDTQKIELDLSYFQCQDGKFPWYTDRWETEFGFKPRKKDESSFPQKYADFAASAQKVLEEAILNLAKEVQELTKEKRLCMAGGVALNGKANGIIIEQNIFEEVFVQPASADDGSSIGAALKLSQEKGADIFRPLESIYLGSAFSNDCYKGALVDNSFANNYSFEHIEDDALFTKIAIELSKSAVVGWFQGASELGPRALGNRSILADPTNPKMKDILNKKIKFREPFRPFAPSILDKYSTDYFEGEHSNAYYMNQIFQVKEDKKNIIPAVTHADGTSRIQVVTQKHNPRFYKLIERFESVSGVPILINTSMNVKGEPIVDSPCDAIKCFMKTGIDILVLGNYFVQKNTG